MRKKLQWLVLICLALPGVSRAQDLPFGVSLPPSFNFATSPNPVGSGARAAGKAFAFIGVADDATAASHNPGGLVQLERLEVSIVGSYFRRLETQDVTQPETRVEDQAFGSLDLNYLSGVYPFQLLRRNVVVSLNVQRLFDLQGRTDVASRFRAQTIDGIQQVNSRQDGGLFTISSAIAVQITPTVSVGAAFNVWTDTFGGNSWEQEVSVQGNGRVVSGNRIVPFVSQGRIREEFDFEGFNVTAGFLWHLTPIFSLGGVVRTPFTADVTHRHRSSLTVTLLDDLTRPPVTTQRSFRESLDMDMPLSYGLGLSARLSDRWTLSLDVSRIHWSDFRLEESTRADVLLVENGTPAGKGRAVLDGKANDTTSARLGAEYLWIRPKVVIPFRAGFFYDPEPGAGSSDNFFGFSLGTGMGIANVLFDVAYEFRTGTVKSEATDTSVQQHRIVASIIYHF
jgi:Outer membrane protein transport protein (OMPP1/FadL/TodX)